jgi:hypothetical protein
MKFVSICISKGFFQKSFSFWPGNNLITSDKNAVGKTTLLRFLLRGIGYQIPSTKGLNFDAYETETKIVSNDIEYVLTRRKDIIEITSPLNLHKKTFLLPQDEIELHKIILPSSSVSSSFYTNLLGAWYFDQEKGWTLLNRGTIIGRYKFSIEEIVRSLANIDLSSILAEKDKIEREIYQYKKIFSIAEYQNEIKREKKEIVFDSVQEEMQKQIDILKYDKSKLENDIQEIEKSQKDNESFKKYIQQMKLTVSWNDSKNIPVNYETIDNFRDVLLFVDSRKKFLLSQIDQVDKNLRKLIAQVPENQMIETQDVAELYNERIAKVDRYASNRKNPQKSSGEKRIHNKIHKRYNKKQPKHYFLYLFTRQTICKFSWYSGLF